MSNNAKGNLISSNISRIRHSKLLGKFCCYFLGGEIHTWKVKPQNSEDSHLKKVSNLNLF